MSKIPATKLRACELGTKVSKMLLNQELWASPRRPILILRQGRAGNGNGTAQFLVVGLCDLCQPQPGPGLAFLLALLNGCQLAEIQEEETCQCILKPLDGPQLGIEDCCRPQAANEVQEQCSCQRPRNQGIVQFSRQAMTWKSWQLWEYLKPDATDCGLKSVCNNQNSCHVAVTLEHEPNENQPLEHVSPWTSATTSATTSIHEFHGKDMQS